MPHTNTATLIDMILNRRATDSPIVIATYNDLFDNTRVDDDLTVENAPQIDGVTILNETTDYSTEIPSLPEYQNPNTTFVLYVGGGRSHAMEAAKYLNRRCVMVHCDCMDHNRSDDIKNFWKMFQGEVHEVECGGVKTLRRLVTKLGS